MGIPWHDESWNIRKGIKKRDSQQDPWPKLILFWLAKPQCIFLAAWQLWKDDFGGRNSWISHLRIAIKIHVLPMHGFVEVYRGSVATVHGRKLKCVAASASKGLKGVFFWSQNRYEQYKHWWGIQPIKHSGIHHIHPFWMIKNSYGKIIGFLRCRHQRLFHSVGLLLT